MQWYPPLIIKTRIYLLHVKISYLGIKPILTFLKCYFTLGKEKYLLKKLMQKKTVMQKKDSNEEHIALI